MEDDREPLVVPVGAAVAKCSRAPRNGTPNASASLCIHNITS